MQESPLPDTITHKRGEGWEEFRHDLKVLAERVYPDLAVEAREIFALNQFLSQLVNPQVSFVMKQTS